MLVSVGGTPRGSCGTQGKGYPGTDLGKDAQGLSEPITHGNTSERRQARRNLRLVEGNIIPIEGKKRQHLSIEDLFEE